MGEQRCKTLFESEDKLKRKWEFVTRTQLQNEKKFQHLEKKCKISIEREAQLEDRIKELKQKNEEQIIKIQEFASSKKQETEMYEKQKHKSKDICEQKKQFERDLEKITQKDIELKQKTHKTKQEIKDILYWMKQMGTVMEKMMRNNQIQQHIIMKEKEGVQKLHSIIITTHDDHQDEKENDQNQHTKTLTHLKSLMELKLDELERGLKSTKVGNEIILTKNNQLVEEIRQTAGSDLGHEKEHLQSEIQLAVQACESIKVKKKEDIRNECTKLSEKKELKQMKQERDQKKIEIKDMVEVQKKEYASVPRQEEAEMIKENPSCLPKGMHQKSMLSQDSLKGTSIQESVIIPKRCTIGPQKLVFPNEAHKK